jgi:hypothetical protein
MVATYLKLQIQRGTDLQTHHCGHEASVLRKKPEHTDREGREENAQSASRKEPIFREKEGTHR